MTELPIINSTDPQKTPPTRRAFLHSSLLATAASTLLRSGSTLAALTQTAHAADVDLLHDPLNGLLAFVVPGPDAYSVAQGVSTIEAGGVDASVAEVLIQTLDLSAPFLPQFSAVVSSILNNLAPYYSRPTQLAVRPG